MKEKNKKILKGLGISALACVGMFGLTGCSNIKVSQNKVDSLIEMAERTDSRLDEYTDLLEKANRLTKEEAWNLAMLSDFNLMMNVNGIRDNMVISGKSTFNNGEIYEMQQVHYNSETFKSAYNFNGEKVYLSYQLNVSNVVSSELRVIESNYVCTTVQQFPEVADLDNVLGFYTEYGFGIGVKGFKLTFGDLNHYENLENGNVKLVFVGFEKIELDPDGNDYVECLICRTFEYSPEGKIISIKENSRVVDQKGSGEQFESVVEESNYEMEYTLSYGTVDTELVESLIELSETKKK